MGLKQRWAAFDELRPSFIIGWAVRLAFAAGVLYGAYRAWGGYVYVGSWPHPLGAWYAIKGKWFSFLVFELLAAAAMLDPGRLFTKKPRNLEALLRSQSLEHGLNRLRPHVKVLKGEGDLKSAIELILRAAVAELECELGIFGKGLIQANLVLAKPPNQIVVVARSGIGHVPSEYERSPQLMSCLAMSQNKTVVQCNVKSLPGFADKEYDCVASTPVAKGAHAFGVVAVDSREPNTFKNKEQLIDRVLRPHCALLLLTVEQGAGYYDCPARNPR